MHTIRLRKPWSRSLNEETNSLKVDVPDAAPLSLTRGQSVRYERPFNCPTGLDAQTKVTLEIESCQAESMEIRLNKESLAVDDPTFPVLVEITPRLQPSNRLEIRLWAKKEGDTCLDGDVKLRIESV